MLAVQLLARVETAWNRRIPLAALFLRPTIEQLAAWIDCKAGAGLPGAGLPKQVIVIQANGRRRPLYVLPLMFGDVDHYHDLSRHLGPDQPVFGLLPALDDGTLPEFPSIEEMASRILEGLRAFQPEGPYSLLGYSFGGPFAFELAQQLTKSGQKVAFLGVIDTGPCPQLSTRLDVLRALPRMLGNLPFRLVDDVFRSNPQELLARTRRKLQQASHALGRASRRAPAPDERAFLRGFIDIDRLPEHVQRFLEVQYRAFSGYQPRVYPGRLNLYLARTHRLWHTAPRDLGWTRLAAGGLSIKVVPGAHSNIVSEPFVGVLARHIRNALDAEA
jgi:thioesterase domain-containing protein